jgi:diphthine methyl ester acylhydrolase
MHAGARVLRLKRGGTDETNGGTWTFEILARFEEHKSMNYGSDFQPGSTGELCVISTSFYDKLLCLWNVKLDADFDVVSSKIEP